MVETAQTDVVHIVVKELLQAEFDVSAMGRVWPDVMPDGLVTTVQVHYYIVMKGKSALNHLTTIAHHHYDHHRSWAQRPFTSDACYTIFCQLIQSSAK